MHPFFQQSILGKFAYMYLVASSCQRVLSSLYRMTRDGVTVKKRRLHCTPVGSVTSLGQVQRSQEL